MNDPEPESPRLTALRFLLRVQEQDLARTRRWIAAEEQREADRAHSRRHRPPPDWMLETGISASRAPVYVHVGDCHMIGTRGRGITRDQAVRALTDGVDACPHCRADTELGVLD